MSEAACVMPKAAVQLLDIKSSQKYESYNIDC